MILNYGTYSTKRQFIADNELTKIYGDHWMDAIVSVAFEYQVDCPNDVHVGNKFIDIVKEFAERPFTLSCYDKDVNKAHRISMEILHSLIQKYSECRLLTVDDHYECTVLLMYLEYLLRDK